MKNPRSFAVYIAAMLAIALFVMSPLYGSAVDKISRRHPQVTTTTTAPD